MLCRGMLFITIASTLLCLAVAAMWVRSYFVRDTLEDERLCILEDGSMSGLRRSLHADGGHLVWTTDNFAFPNARMQGWEPRQSRWAWVAYRPRRTPRDDGGLLQHLGFIGTTDWSGTRPDYAYTYRFTWVPCWLLMTLTGILPVRWIIRSYRTRARRTHGLCMRCGYDLRATPHRCPECGATPAGIAA